MKWQDPFLGFCGMRYSYGVSASLRLNCWLQWPHLATKIHRRGLEFTEKARNIHRIRLVFDSSGLSIVGTTMFDEHEHFWWIHIDLYIVFHAHVHGVLMNMKWPVTKKFHIVAEFTSDFVWLVSSSRPSVLGIARELLAEKCEPWAVVIWTASHKWEKIQFPVTNNRNILQSRWIKLVFWPAQIIGILWGRPTSLPRGPAGKLWSHEGMENAWNGCGFYDGTMQQWFDPISWRQQWGKRSASSE